MGMDGFWLCQGHSSLCKYASGAVSTLGYRYLTYPQNSSKLPFLPNKSQALVAKQRSDRTGGGAERDLQDVDGRYRSQMRMMEGVGREQVLEV